MPNITCNNCEKITNSDEHPFCKTCLYLFPQSILEKYTQNLPLITKIIFNLQLLENSFEKKHYPNENRLFEILKLINYNFLINYRFMLNSYSNLDLQQTLTMLNKQTGLNFSLKTDADVMSFASNSTTFLEKALFSEFVFNIDAYFKKSVVKYKLNPKLKSKKIQSKLFEKANISHNLDHSALRAIITIRNTFHYENISSSNDKFTIGKYEFNFVTNKKHHYTSTTHLMILQEVALKELKILTKGLND